MDKKLFEYLTEKPKCPKCGEKMLDIIYGLPGEEAMKLVENKKAILGGCMTTGNDPKYYCSKCKKSYYKNLKDYI